jgi:hypothetical protein
MGKSGSATNQVLMMGASTKKWTTFDPCKGSNERISKIYIKFQSYGKDSTFKKTLIS